MCSDGLVDEVPSADIASLAAQQREPQAVAEALVELAKRNGGRDNITVVVVDAVGDVPHSYIGESALETPLARSKKKKIFGVGVALVLLVSLAITGRNARSGYFLTFENSTQGSAVCIDHGASSRVLWFAPTREQCSDLVRSDLIPALQHQIDNHSRFTSIIDAQRYIAALKKVSALND